MSRNEDSNPKIALIVRGDDTGGSVCANRAVEQCYREGILRNTSVMGNGEALEDAAARFSRCPGLCVGLHVTLNSEWTFPRYRPVLPPGKVTSLVGSDGCFLPTPQHLNDRGFDLNEAIAETQAQLNRMRAAGLNPQYLDEHMGVGWLPGLAEQFTKLADREGLVVARTNAVDLPSSTDSPTGDRVMDWLRLIEGAPPGRYCLITHPLFDDTESRGIVSEQPHARHIAVDRNADRMALLDRRLIGLCHSPRVRLARYTDAINH